MLEPLILSIVKASLLGILWQPTLCRAVFIFETIFFQKNTGQNPSAVNQKVYDAGAKIEPNKAKQEGENQDQSQGDFERTKRAI